MSNTVIALLVVFAFAAGLGVGLVTVLRPRNDLRQVHDKRRREQKDSAVYFGRDDNDPDHPHDIERQHAHRYDGMADGDVPYEPLISRGLDFGREPR
jgi:hypothetical protein